MPVLPRLVGISVRNVDGNPSGKADACPCAVQDVREPVDVIEYDGFRAKLPRIAPVGPLAPVGRRSQDEINGCRGKFPEELAGILVRDHVRFSSAVIIRTSCAILSGVTPMIAHVS